MALNKYLDEAGLRLLIQKIKEGQGAFLEYKGEVGVKSTDPTSANYRLPDLPTTELKIGFVYNVNEDFITDANFIEGAGKEYPAGTNVAVVNTGTDADPVLKWDVYGSNMASFQTKRLKEAFTALEPRATLTAVPAANDTTYALNDIVMVNSINTAVSGIYRVTAIDSTTGDRTWSGPYGDQSTVEGYIKFLGSVCANTPITEQEILDAFANA